jgi:RNA polymerase sigma factor (sigma-70 family)
MTVLPPFSRVLDEHRDAVWRYLAATAGPVDGADLLQETLVAALRAYPSLRHAGNLRSWLLTIAHRKVIDAARARDRRPVPVAAVPDAGHEPAPVEEDGELWAAVRRLPEKQRSAVVHRFVADLPYADIGSIIGCSEAAARQNVRAGLARLREELG